MYAQQKETSSLAPLPSRDGSGRVRILDFFRGIAVLIIVLYHTDFFHQFFYWGWASLDLFFVLSGFLVSGLLFREYQRDQRIDGKRFLIRRGFKIYPQFYVYLVVITIIAVVQGVLSSKGLRINIINFLAEAFYFQNYHPGIAYHTWSLAVEEHFYFFLTFWILLLIRFDWVNLKAILLTYLSLFGIALFFRWYSWDPNSFSLHRNFFPTHIRMDSLFLGVLISYLFNYHYEQLATVAEQFYWWLIGVGLLFLLPILFFGYQVKWMNIVGLPLVYMGWGIILLCAFVNNRLERLFLRILGQRLFDKVGQVGYYSYSIYVWHLGVPTFVIAVTNELNGEILFPPVISDLIRIALSLTIGILMANWLEFPVLKLRERYFPNKRKVIVSK